MASYGPVYGRTGQYGQGVSPLKGGTVPYGVE